MMAAINGIKGIVEILVQHEIGITINKGCSALMYATESNNIESVTALLREVLIKNNYN